VDPGNRWIVVNLHEVVSKPGETRRAEPCGVNGRYPAETVSTGANPERYDPPNPMLSRRGGTPGSGPTPAELAVPYIPNGPPMQSR